MAGEEGRRGSGVSGEEEEGEEQRGRRVCEDMSAASHHQHSSAGSTSFTSEQTEQQHKHTAMMKTLQEMKKRLPVEKRCRSKGSTVQALSYALHCVKQVQANSEYYSLLVGGGLERQGDASVCSLEQLQRIMSEHTPKNTDAFVAAFSLASGRVVCASDHAPCVLHCNRKFLLSVRFVELLYHQDVHVFYSHTAQPRLPPWSASAEAAVLLECAQVKSFFCRIRGGKDREGEIRYLPFRVTPYLLKVQGAESGAEPCCLVLAERVISGYEAPRVPSDKRVFSTTHSPGCVFLEVDERATPLLGYLPQDLIGSSLLTRLHADDRPLMLDMHRKILRLAGQPPFEHWPVRFRCQNGEYVTLDSCWSSFINPWSRKVAFIIGRHRVRCGPLNEDVFAPPAQVDQPIMCEEVKELQGRIYKLFLQPVHNKGSSGYGSLGSNGSHEHHISAASSSDSNGWEESHREPMTLQQFCAGVSGVKSWGQGACLDSRRKPPPPLGPVVHPGIRDQLKNSHVPSYQQINCVDSIIRYLESCTTSALKRKSGTSSVASSSSVSEEDTPAPAVHPQPALVGVAVPAGSASTAAVVGAPLTDVTVSTEAMSVASLTSQCSYSSTLVHVPRPESEVTALEDAPMGSEPADPAPCPAPEELLLLTKQVLSAHTQKEELQFVERFRHRLLQGPYSSYLQQDRGDAARPVNRHKRVRPEDSSDSYGSAPGRFWPLPHSSWPSSDSSHLALPPPTQAAPYYTVVGADQTPGVPGHAPCLAPPVMLVLLPTYPSGFGLALPQPSFVPPAAQGSSPADPASPALWLEEDGEAGQPTALFSSSRSSSPIQLNLLQEELTRPAQTPPQHQHQHATDTQSSCSETLDQLLQEDTLSGSGESGASLASGSAHTGSSKYFASNDSSDTSRKALRRTQQEHSFITRVEDPLWSMIKQTPQPVMMTYQIYPRDQTRVLQEDREKLLLMRPMQPFFTQEQKEELAEVHPWIQQHSVPQEINTQGCVSCSSCADTDRDPPDP